MRLIVKILVRTVALIAIFLLSVFLWLSYYSLDLSDISKLRAYAPSEAERTSDACEHVNSVTIPYGGIGNNILTALNAAEICEDYSSAFDEMTGTFNKRTAHMFCLCQYSWLVACASHKPEFSIVS